MYVAVVEVAKGGQGATLRAKVRGGNKGTEGYGGP